jgi:hypothetical protein
LNEADLGVVYLYLDVSTLVLSLLNKILATVHTVENLDTLEDRPVVRSL